MLHRIQCSGRLALLTPLALLLVLGCGPERQEVGQEPLQQGQQGLTYTFSGQTSAATNSWLTHPFEATQGSPIKAVLNWGTTSADLNLFLYDPSGTLVAYANTETARPETVTFTANATGTWSVALKCKTGSTSYSLQVTAESPGGYPGRPPAGKLFWGASIDGNGDPVPRHETPSGHPLALRRTFFQWTARATGMITIARDDLAHGRLPWVSIKPPSWSAMANGLHDAEIDEMLRALNGLSGPVWLTIHHEPEGGGGVNAPDDPAGPAGHVAMNRRVRQRMTALGVDNVALVPVLMSWTWDAASGRNPNDWWAPGIYDFLGVDHYRDSQTSMLTATWYEIRTWAQARGVDVGVAEWGMRGTDAAAGQRMREWYNAAANSHSDGRGARVVGLSAFDSGLNSEVSWELQGEQLTTFWELLRDPRTADVRTLWP
jgi:hypothetical protein